MSASPDDPARRAVLADAQAQIAALIEAGRFFDAIRALGAIPPGAPPPPDLAAQGRNLIDRLVFRLLYRGFLGEAQSLSDKMGAAHQIMTRAAIAAYRDDLSFPQRFAIRRSLAELMAAAAPRRPPPTRLIDLNRPLRVGHIINAVATSSSEHFRRHEIQHHDRDRVRLFHYVRVNGPPPAAERHPDDLWVDTSRMNDAVFHQRVVEDGVDILVDHCDGNAGCRLAALAAQPAPVVLGRGGLASACLAGIGWRLGDAITHPAGGREIWSERILRLPLLQCYAPPPDAPADVSVDVAADRPVLFGAFCQPAKITPKVAAVWAAILRAVPGARLRIKRKELTSPDAQTRLTALFKAGDAPLDRIEYAGPSGRGDHFQALAAVDVALDPFPFGGHTTSCETLWMGTPVVALLGESLVSNWGPSYLQAAGCGAWVARTPKDYVRIAVELVQDLARLRTGRAALRAQAAASPLCDGAAWTRSMEDGYRLLAWDWNERRAGRPGLHGR